MNPRAMKVDTGKGHHVGEDTLVFSLEGRDRKPTLEIVQAAGHGGT